MRALHRILGRGTLAAFCAVLLALFGLHSSRAQGGTIRFAVIGDYGNAGASEAAVAAMVASWSPDFIITVGDNNYDSGSAPTIDANIGQYYHSFISPYTGAYGAGADTNRFFPSLGNHDWGTSNAQPYIDFFTLPGNERYYDFVWGAVHFFAVDSDSSEPDGNTSASVQGQWLQNALAASTSSWNLVYFHHAAYSSGLHGSDSTLQWPFQTWGADAVLAGHDHHYERFSVNGIAYFVNGLGGRSIYPIVAPQPGSLVRYADNYGAMLVTVSDTSITFEFYSIDNGGTLIDTFTLPEANLNAIPRRNLYDTATPTLHWNRISWAAAYHVQVDNNSDFSSPEFDTLVGGNQLEVTTSPLPEDRYHWRVQAQDGSTWGGWSAVDHFTVRLP